MTAEQFYQQVHGDSPFLSRSAVIDLIEKHQHQIEVRDLSEPVEVVRKGSFRGRTTLLPHHVADITNYYYDGTK